MKNRILIFLIIPLFVLLCACNKEGKEEGEEVSNVSAVDLGLSVKWADMNLGAAKPEAAGNYYAWGEVETKEDYSWATYKWCKGSSTTMTKYCLNSKYGTVDSKTTLDAEDDVAHVKLGGSWRMPTDAEWKELKENCEWQRETVGGVFGYTIKSSTNGNSIFLPAAGGMQGDELYSYGSSGYYWSSSLYQDNSGLGLLMYFYSNTANTYGRRSFGLPIRAVCQE